MQPISLQSKNYFMYFDVRTVRFVLFVHVGMNNINNKIPFMLSESFHQLTHKRIALKGVLKFTLKQLQQVSV
jgi:hypothetical protein